MKVSLNWLRSLVNLEGIPADDIVHKLTMSGLEVEEVTNENEKYKGFIVGYVKEKNKHPKADKLSICTVYDGLKDLQVICGAPNVEAGQKVVFAPEGTVIPKGKFTIGKAKIRGVESFGMICSEDELELSDDHSGIMILDGDLEIGRPITEALGFNDVLLEIAITPNRPDALSHVGVARDLSAIYGRTLRLHVPDLKSSDKQSENYASVEIEDSVNCPRYSAKVVLNVKIEKSPVWLEEVISKIGLRPINNIVDITNYIMYETGQPLHAFDLDRLAGKKIIVKSTAEKSKFTTLDSKERELPVNTLLICDAEKPVAIAGVMGGENSEISSETRNILIESAYFHPSSIRRTSKSLGLSTDASYRFERGTDPDRTMYAAERAAELMCNIAGGEVLAGSIDVYPVKIQQPELNLRYSRIRKILGYEVDRNRVNEILESLGLKVSSGNEESINIKVPSYRPDIEREIDVIEEIARIYGYDNIPTVRKITITLGAKSDESSFASKIREISSGLGFFEMINNPLQSEKFSEMTGNPLGLLNPLSADMAFLRTSLIPGALNVVQKNIYGGEKNLKLFEIGNVFNKKVDQEIKSFEDFDEKPRLLFLITGKTEEKQWNQAEKISDFYTLKGAINSFLSKFSLDNVLNDFYYQDENRIFDLTFAKKHGNVELGRGGMVKKEVLKQFDIQQDVYCFEFDFDNLRLVNNPELKYSEPLRFPKVIRDFAFIFDKNIRFSEVKDFINSQSTGLLKSVEIFDIFESSSVGENKKSMAFTLEFFDLNRTLTEEEVEKEFTSLIGAVEKRFNAKLRGT